MWPIHLLRLVLQKKRECFDPYCEEHYLRGSKDFSRLDVATVVDWIRDTNVGDVTVNMLLHAQETQQHLW